MLSWIALTLAAGSADLWSYGCDHFLYGACLRVPTGMSVTYEAPADFVCTASGAAIGKLP